MTQFDPLANGPWTVVNDGVMGGRSTARVTDDGVTIRFRGTLSLANNGGFSSVRCPLSAPPRDALGVRIEARGDGREYQLRLRQESDLDGVAWRVPFRADADWRPFAWRFDEFEPVFRGRRVPDAGPLDPARIAQVGVLIADRQPGPFLLEIRALAFFEEPT